MANYDVKKDLDTYFQNNWTETSIQFQGQQLDTTGLDKFISLIYNPVENDAYGFDGSATGRLKYAGLYKVFCYAKNPTKAFLLADQVKAFFNGKEVGNITIGIGQDGSSTDLGIDFEEVLCSFDVSQWS